MKYIMDYSHLYQVHLHPRFAPCSHDETVYILAPDTDEAWKRANALFDGGFTVRKIFPVRDCKEETPCLKCQKKITTGPHLTQDDD